MWLARHTGALSEDISDTIESDVRQPRLLEGGFHRLRPPGFSKWRSRNLAETNLVAYNLRLVGLQRRCQRFFFCFRTLRSGETREKHEPEDADRARDHLTDGTAIQTTEEPSKQAKKFHNVVPQTSRRTSIVIREIPNDANRLHGYRNC